MSKENASASRKKKRVPENTSIALVEAVQIIEDVQFFVGHPKSVLFQDAMYSIHVLLAGVFTNQIVPYPSHPYEEYTLSNCVVFTMTLSKALRKRHTEIQSRARPQLVTNASGRKVLCYGDWRTCPYHLAHCQVPDAILQWKCNGEVSRECCGFILTVSSVGDIALLNSLFPELLCHEGLPSPLQSSIDTLRAQYLNGACSGGEKSLVKRLITLGADINKEDKDGETPLYCASRSGHIDIVKILKDIPGIDVNEAGNRYGETAFWLACRNGHSEIVNILKEIPGIDVNKADNCGKTAFWGACMPPISAACGGGRTDIVNILKDIPGIDVNKADNNGRTPFWWACISESYNVGVVNILKDIPGIDVNKADKCGKTAFCGACSNGRTDIVNILKDNPGIDVNKADNNGRTPFSWACQWGRVDVVNILKAIPGIDVNKADSGGETPISSACRRGHTDIVNILKNIPGIDVNCPGD